MVRPESDVFHNLDTSVAINIREEVERIASRQIPNITWHEYKPVESMLLRLRLYN